MKVLIADDDEMFRLLLEKQVRRWGYDAMVTADGDEAWRALRDVNAPRVAILDWQMPGLDGIEICRRIKRDPQFPFTYVILLTSRDTREDMIVGLNAGADDYLAKPADPTILQSRLKVAQRIVEAVPPREWALPRVPGYEVKRLLGKGAAGSVWEAMHTQTRRRVALKILRLDLVGDEVLYRFAREIQITQGLDHPNLAKVYDAIATETLCCYAMELIDGRQLTDYIVATRPTIPGLLRLMAQVCDGIEYAHRHGIVHRDLKPQNILVTADGQPKVVDFGVAKTLDRTDPHDSGIHTLQFTAIGTPMFMAPEQARGDHERVDARTDVYALGIILYMTLVGHHPHKLNRASAWDIMRSIVDGQVRPLSQFSDQVDAILEKIVMKALAREPDDRYPSAGFLGADLQRYLARAAARTHASHA